MKRACKAILHAAYRAGIPFVLNRGELPFILNAQGLLGEGAEIGVKHGQFSEYLLANWKGRVLHSIDAWKEFPRDAYIDDANVAQENQDRFYRNTCKRLAPFGSRSNVIRGLSVESARLFRDGQLDFVYLDAAHDYQNVCADLAAWFPKVRKGGILAGHDYATGLLHGTDFGVKAAVDEFAGKQGCKVKISLREPDHKSWFIFL